MVSVGHDLFTLGAAVNCDGVPLEEECNQVALFIIDPQIDFHPPEGSLGVPGAVEDSQRIIKLIDDFGESIDRIIVTLDTHHQMHIAHGGFWMNEKGEKPAPFTIITAKEISDGKWKARQQDMRAWALEYAEKLEAGGRFKVCIWPEHCLLGSAGHAVYPPLADCLHRWARHRMRNIHWLLKGQNNLTEMYSALKAEVMVDNDQTVKLNKTLIDELTSQRQVLCCGEAKSHCVNYSVRDLLSGWPADRAADIVLLNDACSSVPGFEDSGATFEKDMIAAGVTVCKCSQWRPPSSVSLSTSPSGYASPSRLHKSPLSAASPQKKSFAHQIKSGETHPICGAAGVCDGKPKNEDYDGSALLIIDPQNDFHPPDGSLGVPGAIEDTQRIIELIEKHGDHIGRIIVTLDTHHQMHIAHGAFWEDESGKSPTPFTIITAAEIKAGKWRARQKELRAWSLEYAEKLEAGGRFKVCIWPEHCLMGSPGHACWPALAECLHKWAFRRLRNVVWLLKGQNNRTEMYSALKAEVECADDPAASLNMPLIETLAKHQNVICCGEAKSHCVNYSVRDLLSGWPKGREKDIVVLSDACSAVPSFESIAMQFETDMKAAGVTVCKASEWTPPPKGVLTETWSSASKALGTFNAGNQDFCKHVEETCKGLRGLQDDLKELLDLLRQRRAIIEKK